MADLYDIGDTGGTVQDDEPGLPYLTDPNLPMVPIAELHTHPEQVNEPDIGAIAESMRFHGFYGDVYVQASTNNIIAGHGRVAAAEQIGYTEVPVCYLDVDDDTATRILLIDNEAARKASNNPGALFQLLAELQATPLGLSGTGFELSDLEGLARQAAQPMFSDPVYLVVIPCEDADHQAGVLRDVQDTGYDEARAETR